MILKRRRRKRQNQDELDSSTLESSRLRQPGSDHSSQRSAIVMADPMIGAVLRDEIPALALRSPGGEAHQERVSGQVVRLHGETTATFDGGTSQMRDIRQERTSGCANCGDDGCIRVRGTMVLNFRVVTHVSLPSVNDYPDLTACQRERVQNAIDNILAPHEQEHVDAFETYNGTVERAFDLKVCSAEEANARLQEIHDTTAAGRETTARNASDALDPFHFDVDLDCEDEESGSDGEDAGSTPAPQADDTVGAQVV